MPHIPGFPGGSLGSNAPQQPPASIPQNFHPFTPQQQQAFLAQHQLHQQRQLQSSPPQPQLVQGVPDPEHQRMWQAAMDQHVRPHNDATQSNPTFTQMAEYLRAGGVPHPQLAQQARIGLPGFSQQTPSQNPQMNPSPNPNPNPMHHGLAPNPGAPSFPASSLSQLTAAQLQGLAERHPPMRAAIQQHQQRQQAQAQAQAQQQAAQQQQQHGMIANPFDNFGLNLTANTQQVQHSVTPANAAATVNINQAELSRQYQLMSRAGQNQGQNGSTLNQASPALHPNRSQQPLSQSIQSGQIPAGTIPMGAHVIAQQTHPGTGQPVINRSMFAGSSAQFAPAANPNLVGTGHPQSAPQQQNPVNPQQRAMVNFRNFDPSKIEQQLALLLTQITNAETQLRSIGFNPSMMQAQLTDDQRGLLAELQNKKTMYAKLSQIRQQLERFQSSTQGLQGTPPAAGDVGMIPNGNIVPSSATVSQAQAQQAQLVHAWLQHSAGGAGVGAGVQHAQKAEAPQPPALVARPPSQARMETHFSQSQLSQYQLQQQQQQPAQRSASVQPQPTPAQIVHRQQPQGMQPLVSAQQQQQQSHPFSVGQAPPPPVTLPQQQQMRATFVETLQLPERATFDAQLKQVLVKQKLTIDPATLLIEGKEINLYDLETEVIKRGGGNNVTQHSLWPAIGASLGWVAYPANGTESAKSAPQVAHNLMTLHRTYLLTWESVFIQRVLQEKRRRAVAANAAQIPASLVGISQPQQQPPPPPPPQQQQQIQPQQQSQQPQQLPPPHSQQQAQAQPPQPPQPQPQAQQQLVQRQQPPNGYPFSQNHHQNQIPGQQSGQSPEDPRPPQQPQPHLGFRPTLPLSTYIQFAHMSAEDMRKRGIPPQSIAFIESNRENLLRRWELYQQQARSGALAQPPTVQPQQPVPQQQGGAHPPGSFPVPPEVARALQGGVPGSVPNVVPQSQGQSMAPRPAVPPTRPSQAQMNAAITFIRMIETDYSNKRRTFPQVLVAEHEKGAYMQRFDQLWRAMQDMEKNLVMYHALFEDEQTAQRIVAIIVATKEQRRLLTSPAAPPQYILSLQAVQLLLVELSNMLERFHKTVSQIARNLHGAQLPPPSTIPPAPAPVTGSVPAPAPAPMVVGPHPHPTPQSQAPARSIAPPPQPVAKTNNRKASATGGDSTPSPAPAHTPAAAAQTPPATSPRTPKSPAKKTVAKNKPAQKRRVSKASQRPPTPVPAAAPVTVPMEPSTEKQTPPKRPREEEPESQGVAAPQATGEPSPKRAKLTEWDGQPSEELNKRRKEVEDVKTEQDVQTFLTRATEDLITSGNDDGAADGGVPDSFRQTLQELFKGTPLFDLPDVFLSSSSDPVLGGAPASSSPKMVDGTLDSFEDFFDFSQCAPDEPVPASSKLDTPELVHGSSANPSPESVAETPKGDHAAIASNKAKDVAHLQETISSHTLSLGGWEEINGGEPAFYEHPGFKWEGEMPVLESPWAISSAGA